MLEQCVVSAGQVGSPPPDTVAVLLTVVPFAAGSGVTGMTKLAFAPIANPAGMEQLTVWPVTVQPAGAVPMARLAGIVSLTVATAVVAALPVLVAVSV